MRIVQGAAATASPIVRVPSGATLEERREPGGEIVVALRAADGSLVVEYLPQGGMCRIHARGVEVRAEADLDLRAGRRVHIEATEGVTLRSGESSIALGAESIGMVASSVETQARRLVQRVGELETQARRVVERARETFREVEELAQTRAGRMRLVAEDTFRVLGRRASLKATEDMKLRGERIYLD